jgi:hypothetical protein
MSHRLAMNSLAVHVRTPQAASLDVLFLPNGIIIWGSAPRPVEATSVACALHLETSPPRAVHTSTDYGIVGD